METITNIVNTATSTVSNAIYGQPETKTNETGGQEPVSGQTGKGTVDEPYDQGNSESALAANTPSTTATGGESSRVTEPTGSIQKPEDLIKAYDNEAGDSTFSNTGSGSTATGITDKAGVTDNGARDSTFSNAGSGSTATGITDKAGVTDKVWKPTDVDAVNPSIADPNVAPEHGIGSTGSAATGKDTLWRGVDAYKDPSSTGPTSTGITTIEPTSTGITSAQPSSTSSYKDTASTNPTSTGSTATGSELNRLTSGESSSSGPKGAIDAEPRTYSIGDLTSGKETPPKPVGDNTTSSANTTSHKTGDAAVSPPDLSTTSPGGKPDYSADTHQPSGHGGLQSAQSTAPAAPAGHQSSISPSGDDDEKNGKMSGLKDKLKTKLHIGSKDH